VPATATPPGPSAQQSPLAQAQARIQQLEYQINALADKVHMTQPQHILVLLAVAVGVMTVVSIILGWLVAGRILRPLHAMTTTTREISEHDLDRRLAMPGPGNELTDLADTIDGLLARLQAAFDAQRQLSRTPRMSCAPRSPLSAPCWKWPWLTLAPPSARCAPPAKTCSRQGSSRNG
jgi:nitrate/nitrite-specific signal transduction histidine kinase